MANDLPFSIDLDSPLAVYMQIENQVKLAIASGRIQKGEKLPSVREMSAHLGVNPNTVTKAYRDLELLGLVNTRRGVGVTVADGAAKLCREKMRDSVKRSLQEAVSNCLAAGYTSAQIRSIVSQSVTARRVPVGTDHR